MIAINVERDKNGMWVHPELPEWGENTTEEKAKAWFSSQGLKHHLVLMDGELGERWGVGELTSCAEWQPEIEVKDAFLVGIWDTEEGVVAMFASPLDDEKKFALEVLRDAIQTAEQFGLVRTEDDKIITGAVITDTGIVLTSE